MTCCRPSNMLLRCVIIIVAVVAAVPVPAAGVVSGVAMLEQESPLACLQQPYEHRVVQVDDHGRRCWDRVQVTSCRGRCDSREISDWRFPYKRSFHPVCVHGRRVKAVVLLRNCDPGVTPGTERYEYMEAASCRCQTCTSQNTSCEGPRLHPNPYSLSFESFDQGNFID